MNRPILDNVMPTLLGPVRALLDKKADDKDVVKSVNGSKPDESGNVDVSGLPEGAAAHQQLVTDETGAAKWEARTHYVAPDGTVHPLDAKFIPETIARTADVNAAVSALGTVLRFKGAVATVDLLPTEGNELGDVYYVTEGSSGYAWIQDEDGTQRWEQLGPMISGEFLPTGATAHQQLVTDGEGKAKWEKRLAYTTEPVETVLMEEQTIAFEVTGNMAQALSPVPIELVAGNVYKVTFDGTEYQCTAQVFAETYLYIGNAQIFGLSNTGEPFVYAVVNGQMIWGAVDELTSHVIGVVSSVSEDIPVDTKYLPAADYTAPGIVKFGHEGALKHYEFKTWANLALLKSAIDDFNSNGASIVWDGYQMIKCYYNDEYIYVTFAESPYEEFSYSIGDSPDITSTSGTSIPHDCNVGRVLFGSSSVTIDGLDNASDANARYVIISPRLAIGGIRAVERGLILDENAIIMRSSVSGSTKRFKITVDDSGTLTTTEV